MRRISTARAQSAMEYLMTYGWAILIIAVVLGALFQLGIFNSGALLGTACVAGPGYLCSTPTLTPDGNVIFIFGQSTGSPIYNVGFSCAATSDSGGYPSPRWSFNAIDGSVYWPVNAQLASPSGNFLKVNSLILMNGQTATISKLPCFGTTGVLVTAAGTTTPIGTSFSGSLWINYTTTQYGTGATTINAFGNIPGGGNWLTAKVATLTMKVA